MAMDNHGGETPTGPNDRFTPASRPSTPATSAKYTLPATPILNEPNKPIPTNKDQSIWSKFSLYAHIEPALIYWLIATVLILMGYDLAAFIPIILCIGDGLECELWVVGAINPFIWGCNYQRLLDSHHLHHSYY